jgi:hypothetical protein
MEGYHLSRGGRTIGVYPEDKLREYIAQGRVGAGDLVWKPGMPAWLTAGQVFGFAQDAPPPAAEPASLTVAAPGAAAPASVAPPPRFHWGWVLLLSIVTLGLFYIVWAFVQAAWVRRLDPSSNALKLLAIYLVLTLVGEWLADTAPQESAQVLAGALLSLAGAIVSIFAFFSMRRSLLARYGDGGPEPIGLKLGRAMTFIFNVLYFQHHLTRIAKWKEDGGPSPQ